MFSLVRRAFKFLGSKIQFKIILPYAILTLMVAMIGTYLSTNLVTGSLQDRFTRQLVDTATSVTDGIAQREQRHLTVLRAIAFTEGVDEAILGSNQERLRALIFPIIANDNVIDRVDVINSAGLRLITIRRPPSTSSVNDYTLDQDQIDMTHWPTVDKVLKGVVDEQGDKHVALTGVDDGDKLFITAGPVKQGETVVGAVVVSSHQQSFLDTLKPAAFADIITLYDLSGQVIFTTLPNSGSELDKFRLEPNEVQRLLDINDTSTLRRQLEIRDREYDLLHAIFWARGEPLGFFSVALQTQFIEASTSTARNQMVVIFVSALVLVFGIGYITANRITNQVQYLMENAQAVASGDFSRRTELGSQDEIGMLARSLDHMTDSLARYTNDLQHKIEELTALYESSTAVAIRSGLNLDQVLRTVALSIKDLLRNVDQIVIHLLDSDDQILTPIIAMPVEAHRFPALILSQKGLIHNILMTAKPQVVRLTDIESYSPQGAFHMDGHTTAIVVPLVARQEAIGLLTLTLATNGMPPETHLTDDMERLLGTFANQAAMAIKNAQLFEATERAYQELQQLDDLKTEFINIAAHELRTPLGAIMGHASFVEKRAPENLRKYMSFIVISALRMRTMVDAMLTIQRLDAGTAFLKLKLVDIRDTINKVVSDYRPMAELEGHTLTVNFAPDLPPVEVDPEKIGLVFSNLLSNAIKFTPEQGRIEISAWDGGDSLMVSVQDNGVGIPPEDQNKIFERFYQARADHIAGHGGIGIGLTIVKHLLELHGGDVWIESQVGQGSTFSVRIPKTYQPAPTTSLAVTTIRA